MARNADQMTKKCNINCERSTVVKHSNLVCLGSDFVLWRNKSCRVENSVIRKPAALLPLTTADWCRLPSYEAQETTFETHHN